MKTRSNRPTDGREFVRMSVDIARHPKIVGMADPAAAWGYAAALAYCGEYHTDGWITIQTIAREAGISTQKTRKLVAAGLVHEAGHTCKKCPEISKGQAYVHDYLEHNRSKTEVEEQRRSAADKGAKGAAKRWANTPETGPKTAPVSDSYSYSPSHSRSDARSMAEVEEEITTHLPATAAAGNVTREPAHTREAEQPHTGPGITGPTAVSAKHLVQRIIGTRFPATIRTALAIEIGQMVTHYPETVLVEALETWKTRTGIGPRMLPNLVADIVKDQANADGVRVRSSVSGARSARSEKVQAWAELGADLQASLDAGRVGFAPLLIEGGRSA
jgi:hypothetical protein